MATTEITKVIDLKKVLRSSKSRFYRNMPGFIIRIMERLVYQDDINLVIHQNREKSGVPFMAGVLSDWGIKVEINGFENIPETGRFIFAANHPLGAIDAMAFYTMIYRRFPDVISPTNQLLGFIPNLNPVMLGINAFGKNSREVVSRLDELFGSDAQIMIFPSGEVSRRKGGIIADPAWQKSFVTKAIQHKRDIIPVHISGRNSNFFYSVANIRTRVGIKTYLETLLLPREMILKRNSTVVLTPGKPISWQSLTPEKSHVEWAGQIRKMVYDLAASK